MSDEKKYVRVILPLKFGKSITYSIPDDYADSISIGSIVKVTLVNKIYSAVVESITHNPEYDIKKIKPILGVRDVPAIRESEIKLWQEISKYYMCTVGEVYKAASPYSLKSSEVKPKNKIQAKANTKSKKGSAKESSTPEENTPRYQNINPLSEPQQEALDHIESAHSQQKVVLLNGVTGSGKTEVYIHLMQKCLEQGKNVLYLLPEIAVSRQISHRLEKIFGDDLLVYHSKQSISKRKEIISTLANQHRSAEGSSSSAKVILGLRSALFLPFENLGLIIIDEEHDSSYKQSSPAPRYNGRDGAIILSTTLKCNVLLGSATPSFESLLNVKIGKYVEVMLTSKFHNRINSNAVLIDMVKEWKKNAVKGGISKILLKEIQAKLDLGEQVLIFRSRRAYSPYVQCTECGYIPRCTNCNIHLSYHKFNGSLSCHYCGLLNIVGRIEDKHPSTCSNCNAIAIKPFGRGTEKIEEDLQSLFPEKVIARFDADTIKTKGEEDRILKDFAKRKIDILVGTQMISKGFDFDNLTLVAIIQAESLLAINDFRGDEKTVQLLTQLLGRAGRREKQGTMFIQTTQPEHPVFGLFLKSFDLSDLLSERKDYDYPPYVRLINITLRDKYPDRLKRGGQEVRKLIFNSGILEFNGPIAPPIEKTHGEYILHFNIKLRRNNSLGAIKEKLFQELAKYERDMIIDVDPI